MTGTTTIRVDLQTHGKLLALASASGASLMDTVGEAAEALRRQRFAEQVVAELEVLKRDAVAWEAYLADAEETSVPDGVR